MNRLEELNNKLYEKMKAEYDSFCAKTMELPPKEILEKSYEKVFKEDILCCFENDTLPYDKAKALYKLEYPLDEIYESWLNNDCSYMEDLRDTINDRCDFLVKEMKAKHKDMER